MAFVVLLLVVQVLVAVLSLVFGVLAFRVARRAEARHTTGGWWLTGVAFTVEGAHATVQTLAAAAAQAAGKGSVLYEAYLAAIPAAHHGRSFLLLAYAAVLLVLAASPAASVPPRTRSLGVLLLLLVLGTVYGAVEGSFQAERHYPALAWITAATVLLLLVALYRALDRPRLDYLLWMAVALYAAREAVSATFVVVYTYLNLPLVWRPHPLTFYVVPALYLLLMIGCAVRRLALARAGLHAPPILRRLRPFA